MNRISFASVELSDPRFERDGLRMITVRSGALGRRADICFWAPPLSTSSTTLPLLILLHGSGASAWSWALNGGAHLTDGAAHRQPGKSRPSRWRCRRTGYGAWAAVTSRTPTLTMNAGSSKRSPPRRRWPTIGSTDSSPLTIAGLSMGGFGALRLGAKYPDRFRGISAHSAVTTLGRLAEATGDHLDALPSFAQPDGTALHWLEVNAGRLPPLRFDCGNDDPLLPSNRGLHAALEARGIEHQYEEFAGGHDWPYWRLHLADSLRFLDAAATRAPGAAQ